MANAKDVLISLSGLGFETAGNFCFGAWRNYSLLLQPSTGKNLLAVVAVQIPDAWGAKRKTLARSLKEKGVKGLKLAGLTKIAASFALSYGKAESLSGFFTEALDTLTAALKESGINPPDTCALSGAARPDSLCLVPLNGALSYRPVCAAAVRERDTKTREKIEDNKANGSYALGIVGALLGVLVGVVLNVLGIVFTERIYALLFALVPLAAMFGYKLCGGKMSKGSIAIVVLLSLLAVLLIPFAELSYYLVKEYGYALGEALATSAAAMTEPAFLSEISGELIQLLLFMALGIWIAWRYISGQTNSSQALSSETQTATLRPNPACVQEEETDSVY